MNWRRVLALAGKEWIQNRRDVRSLIVIFLLPVVLLALYGYGVNFDLKDIPFAIWDRDQTATSRALLRAFAHPAGREPPIGSSGRNYFLLKGSVASRKEAKQALAAGKVRFVLVIPRAFEANLKAGRAQAVQLLIDAADSNTASVALGYSSGAFASFWEEILERRARAKGLPRSVLAPPLELRTTVLYNPALHSSDFIVPGLIAVILMMLSALLTSGTIVRERERGSFEAICASPVTAPEIMVGKIIPYVIIALADVILAVVAGVVLFGVIPRGNLILLSGISVIFLVAALGIGLFISTVARTQQLATLGAILATVLPSVLLSGFVYPLRNAPLILRGIAQLIPATHFLIAIRNIYLKAVGLDVIWKQTLILILFAFGIMLLSAKRFSKQL